MADIIGILGDKNGNNFYPIARGVAADSIDTAALKDDVVTTDKIADSAVTTDKIANGNVTQEKLAAALFNRFPRAIAQGTTSTTNNFSFDVGSDLNFCWIVVISKFQSDGTASAVLFIRCGATAVSKITSTGTGGANTNYSVSKTAITGGYRISLTSSAGDLKYAKFTVYQFMEP